jgi:hypothetical protein
LKYRWNDDAGLSKLANGFSVTLYSKTISDKSTSLVYNIIGKIWASPMTAIGLIVGGALWAVGKLIGRGSYAKFENNALTFTTGFDFVIFPFFKGSITFGNVIIHAHGPVNNYNSGTSIGRYDNTNIKVNVGRHEEEHTYQYERYGIFMPIIWFISALINRSIGKTAFERAADDASEIIGQW